MTELPNGWDQATLGEIAETSLGKMLDRNKGSKEHLRPYLRNVNVQWGRIDQTDILTMDIPPDQEERFRLLPGDLLVCEGGEIGRCAIWSGGQEFMAYQKALHRVRPLGGIDPRYIRFFLEHLSLRGRLSVWATGSTIKHLPQEQLRQIPLPVPPLAEQRRIVAALEENLSRLEVGTTQLNVVESRVARFRESYGESLEAELRGEQLVRLGELLSEPLRNGHSVRASQSGSVRTISLTAVTRGEFVDRYTKMTAADHVRVRDLWLKAGDILIQRSNTPDLVGTAALYDGPDNWAIFPDLLIRVRLKNIATPAFVVLVLQTPHARRYFRSLAKGLAGSMPKIDQHAIHEFQLGLPPLDQQANIVRHAEEMANLVGRAASGCRAAKQRAVRLRMSLLAEAFAGRLVPQDPSDEPASELLARIRAERAAAPPQRKARSRRTQKELPAPPTRVTGVDYQQEALPL